MNRFFKGATLTIVSACILIIIVGVLPLDKDSGKKHRSVSYIINHFIFQKSEMTAINNTGHKFTFNASDAVGKSIYKSGFYEPNLTNFITNTISYSKDDIFIDVGANIGWYSILLASIDQGPGQIYSFEPDTLNHHFLSKNIEDNNATNIKPINQALSNKSGKATLYQYKESNLGRHSLLPINDAGKVVVETTTLDIFATENHLIDKRIKLVKIDVEGFEYFVLNGSKKLLKNTDYLIHEFSPLLMEQGGVSLDILINELYALDMKPFILSGTNLIKVVDLQKLEEGENIIWISNSMTA